jgi:AraC family carnitine catabolism transcriptional activator
MRIEPDHSLANFPSCDFVVLLDGNLPTMNISTRMLTALRAAHRYGATIVGIDTGAFAIAAAGLAGHGDAVVHWEAAPAFIEHYPDVQLGSGLIAHSQKMMVAARAMAEKKAIGHLS